MSRTGIVAALAAEGRTLGRIRSRSNGLASLADGSLLAVTGIGELAAAHGARALVTAGVTALASWGVAGGLDPLLAAGTLVLPLEVLAADGRRFPTSDPWRTRANAALGAQRAVVGGVLLSSSRAIDTATAKSSAFRATGATTVDMESVAIAEVATAHRLPFLAVRAIVDTATDALPRAVVAASRAGRLQTWRLLRGLLVDPRDVAALLRLARRYRVARHSLGSAARAGVLVSPT